MKIKTSELSGAALDWAVAKCEDRDMYIDELGEVCFRDGDFGDYSSDWSQGGPIIERFQESETTFCLFFNPYKDHPEYGNSRPWSAEYSGRISRGETLLIAAMRCYVASKLGDIVDIPEELLK